MFLSRYPICIKKNLGVTVDNLLFFFLVFLLYLVWFVVFANVRRGERVGDPREIREVHGDRSVLGG